MTRPQQYNFPPPPPPPGPPSSNPHIHQYNYNQQSHQYPQNQHRSSGVNRGGRGGYNNRGEFHGAVPYNSQHPGGVYDPRHPQPGSAPGPPSGFNGPNRLPISAPYTGPQSGTLTHQNYNAGHWSNNQHGPQHSPSQPQPQQPSLHHPIQHPSQPPHLPVQNYHPNYPPQTYQQSHYTPQQPSPYQTQPPSYGHSVPPNQPSHAAQVPPQQWQGPSQPNRPPFSNHRGRGGFNNNGRGSFDSPAPLMGPPIRMGFDNDRGGGHKAQVGTSFPTPHVNHHTPVPFTQPSYQGYSPQDFSQSGQRLLIDTNSYNPSQKARCGGLNSRGKGRGDFHQPQIRNRHDTRQFQNSGPKPPLSSDNNQKPAGSDVTSKKKKKRKTNTLGLTPNGVEHDDSDEEVDDVDEEARLVTLLGPDTPQLPTDLEAWLAERKSKFPTKARREAAAEQLRQRREQILEAKRKKDNGERVVKKEDGETKLEKQQRKAEKLRLELEKAERKIQQEISGSKRKRENGDEGDDDRGQVSDDDSDSSTSSDSDDKPEIFSSRGNGSMRLPPPPKAQLQRHCKYFSTGGTCGKKGKCRFVHDQEVRNQALRDKEANGGKMTLAQRLILNDTAKDDLTILKSIKYLKEKGLMPDQLTGSTPRYDDESRVKGTENGDKENLNLSDNLSP